MEYTAEIIIRNIKLYLLFDIELESNIKKIYEYTKDFFGGMDIIEKIKDGNFSHLYYKFDVLCLIKDTNNKEFGFKNNILERYYYNLNFLVDIYLCDKEMFYFVYWYLKEVVLKDNEYRWTTSF